MEPCYELKIWLNEQNQNFHTNGHKNYDTENLDKKKIQPLSR
jgi:hypothetical protein